MLLLLINYQLSKLRAFTLVGYPRVAYCINNRRSIGVDVDNWPLERPSKLKRTTSLGSAFRLYGMSIGLPFASSMIIFTTNTVAEAFAALFSLRGCKQWHSRDFYLPFLCTLLGVTDLSFLTIFFGGEATTMSWKLLVSTTCRRLIFRLICRFAFRGASFYAFPSGLFWLEGVFSSELKLPLVFKKNLLSHISALVSCFTDLSLSS